MIGIQAKATLLRTLKSERASVVILSGNWGIGKTFMLRNLRSKDEPGNSEVPVIAMVSLFGAETFRDVQSRIISACISTQADITDIDVKSTNPISRYWKKALPFLRENVLDRVSIIAGDAAQKWVGTPAVSEIITEQLLRFAKGKTVAIDDIERMGSSVEFDAFLGLVNTLKERHDCNVILILNEQKLKAEDADKFVIGTEKHADRRIEFDSSPESAAELVFRYRPDYKEAARACVALGIVNLRNLYRVVDHLDILSELTPPEVHSCIRDEIAKLTAVIICSLYRSDDSSIPSIEFLRNYTPEKDVRALMDSMNPSVKIDQANQSDLNEMESIKKRESIWRGALRRVNLNLNSPLTTSIEQFVSKGWMDQDEFQRLCFDMSEDCKGEDRRRKYFDFWQTRFYYNFKGDSNQFIKDLVAVTLPALEFISAGNVQHTLEILDHLDAADGKKKILAECLKPGVFKHYTPYDSRYKVDHPELLEVLRAKIVDKKQFLPKESLERLLDRRDSAEDLFVLSQLSPEELSKEILSFEGKGVIDLIPLIFRARTICESEAEKSASDDRMRETLKLIRNNSPLNAARVDSIIKEQFPESFQLFRTTE